MSDRYTETKQEFKFYFFGGVAAAIVVSSLYAYFGTRPEMVCLETSKKLYPVYAPGPKHHIKGPLTGYVEADYCSKEVPKEKTPFVWPKAAY